jgi:trk system potassium uptake protein TrkH
MNYGTVANLLGKILLIESAALTFPLLVSLYYRQNDTTAFILTILVTALAGGLLAVASKSKKGLIKIREGLIVVSLGWVLISFFGSLPIFMTGSVSSFTDAFFETISGFSTTGATILSDVESLPYGILFWRSFTHWIGGMGILVFTLSILPAVGVGGFQIFKAETTGPVVEKITPQIKDTARILYRIYLTFTLLEILLLVIGGMNLFDASVYTFGSVGTGGFATKNISVGAYNSTYIHLVISIFMIISGINFSLHYSVARGRWKDVLQDRELRFYLGVIAVSVVLITVNLISVRYSGLLISLRDSLFQVGSIITTTGYSTTNFDTWPAFSKSILFILMFIGGCSGSTGGAMKNIRILVLIKLVKREITKVFHPKAVIPVRLGNKTISSETLGSIASFFVLYIFIFVVGTILVTLDGADLVTASSSVAATLGNIGPGFGMVGPAMNFGHFSTWTKWLFSFLMLLGRLELFTVLVLFSRKFWTDK